MFFFFFSSRRRHTRWNCDWSSDVCSSDLAKGDVAPGFDADLALLDPDRAFTVSAADSPSGQGYTPFEGQRLTGQVTATFLRGELAWEDGRTVGPPRGRYLRRPTRSA